MDEKTLDKSFTLDVIGEIELQAESEQVMQDLAQKMYDETRDAVIAELRHKHGGDRVVFQTDKGNWFETTVQDLADHAMRAHYEKGLNELDQPWFPPEGSDVRTVFGSTSADMTGKVNLTNLKNRVLREGSKSTPVVIKKSVKRSAASAQRKARKQNRKK
ncbi:hypothetical protein YOLOSWAG_33 [Erwinia phage vB_EamM_Yoloswag]|uniref:Uncharacterized protein n=1 Tax=Erwinia phage vB_EamM_Yoloswag TaxID=1958956 RepID=A0A1S6L2W2_9CAUD|nr:hypothetical protein HOR66_gp033 [Erwinia phage vB_EamM_Yoloswag]AQT28518.1 hypothetical protein YOLOSWAG_33 [Erwinia phage vB_EamM_Yoloswag]